MRRDLIGAVAVAFVAAHAGAARAQDEPIVGVLHVEVVGVSETAAEMFEDSLEDGLGNAGFRAATRERMRELLEPSGFIDGCRFGPCLQTVYEITGVEIVLVARITGVGKNFTYVVTLFDTRTGLHTAQATDTCAVCTVDEAVATASMAVIGLVTGTGDASVTDPGGNPTDPRLDLATLRAREAALEDERGERRRSVRRGAVFLLSMAAVSGVVSAAGFLQDERDVGYGAAAAGGAFAISSATLFVISRKF